MIPDPKAFHCWGTVGRGFKKPLGGDPVAGDFPQCLLFAEPAKSWSSSLIFSRRIPGETGNMRWLPNRRTLELSDSGTDLLAEGIQDGLETSGPRCRRIPRWPTQEWIKGQKDYGRAENKSGPIDGRLPEWIGKLRGQTPWRGGYTDELTVQNTLEQAGNTKDKGVEGRILGRTGNLSIVTDGRTPGRTDSGTDQQTWRILGPDKKTCERLEPSGWRILGLERNTGGTTGSRTPGQARYTVELKVEEIQMYPVRNGPLQKDPRTDRLKKLPKGLEVRQADQMEEVLLDRLTQKDWWAEGPRKQLSRKEKMSRNHGHGWTKGRTCPRLGGH